MSDRDANARRRAAVASVGARWLRHCAAAVLRIVSELAAELARINRAGLRTEALAARPRHARARLVRAALTRRYRRRARCC